MVESNSGCYHTSDNKIRPPSSGSPICLLRRVWLQTVKLDDTKSYYQLIMTITISEKRRIAKLWKKRKIDINVFALETNGLSALFHACLRIRKTGTKSTIPDNTSWLNWKFFSFSCETKNWVLISGFHMMKVTLPLAGSPEMEVIHWA